MRRGISLILVLLLYSSLLGGSFLFWQDKFQASLVSPKRDLGAKENTITLLFAGDVMLDRGVEWYMKEKKDWAWPFRKVASDLQKADLVFANLESVISDKGEKQGSIYSFRADPKTLGGLAFSGIDIVSVANNHSLDYGPEALLDSQERLQEKGISPVGGGATKKEAHAPVVKTIQGTSIAILAYTSLGSPLWQAGERNPGIAWMDDANLPQLKKDIKSAKELSDIVVISFHFGDEYQKEPTATQRLLSTSAIDYGADLVVGHHPHVVGPLVKYNAGWIAYSLGNFVFDQSFSPETMEGMLLQVQIKEKGITSVMPLSIEISRESQPAISIESMK